jgi:putative drug exporter of the RND superfamily
MALALAEAVFSMQRAHADDAVAINAVAQTPTTECSTSTSTAVTESACGGDILDTTSGARRRGVFGRLGDFVVRWPVFVIGAWVTAATVLSVMFPPLTQIAREHPVEMMPANAPAAVTAQRMAEAFHESGSDNLLLAVLTNEKGLGPADDDVYRRLVGKLRQDSRDVMMLQDFLSTPALREIMESKDHKAWFLPIDLAGTLDTPKGTEAYTRVADIVKQTAAGSTLTANVTGPSATISDLTDVGDRDMHAIEIATGVLVLIILLIVYRNPITMVLPLITIGASLVTARATVAGLSQLGLGVSHETIIMMTAIMAGAGTDYAVFLISRYHECVRLGADSDHAAARALASVGKVLAASAATVAVTFFCMIFVRLGLLSTIGPALAVSVGVVFLAAVTLLPAILVLAGRRGWIVPRRDLTTSFWRRSGIRIARRPAIHLVASLVLLVILAVCGCFVRYNWDESKSLPDSAESNRGSAAMARHFPLNSTIPQYLLIQSQHDLRTPKALADLEQMAGRVSQLPGIAMVRGITRPTGEPLEQARVTYQVGEVGSRLGEASKLVTGRTGDLDLLANGAGELAGTLDRIKAGVSQAVSGLRGLVDAYANSRAEVQGLADNETLDRIAGLARQLQPLVVKQTPDPQAVRDPQVQAILDTQAMHDAQTMRDAQAIESTVNSLRGELRTAANDMRALGLDNPAGIRARLATLQQGIDTLASASRRLADGVQLLVDQTKKMSAGLGDASAFLLALKRDASDPAMAGFYIPAQALTDNEFKKAADVFVSPDGHSVRYLIQTDLDPFSTDAMDQVNAITNTARGAQVNTALADASISMAGFPAEKRDLRDYYNHDLRFVIAATIIVVLLILIVLLRAVIAPLYLIVSVVISYLSTLGIGVIAIQFILGQQLSWSVPGIAFIVLVAVGADYNMLLISRVRDESPHGVRSGVIRTVGSTGGVITSAGVIFAASMFGLLFGSIAGMVQAGFIIGVGLLVDTFIVRTVTVPALAVLVGRANWWPTLRGRPPHSPVARTKPLPAPEPHDSRAPEVDDTPARAVHETAVPELADSEVLEELEAAVSEESRECGT